MVHDTQGMPHVVSPEEVERIIWAYSEEWEGKRERALDLGEALVRVAPPIINKVTHLALDPTRVDERLDILIARVAADAGRCVWMIGPGTRPAALNARLLARGFTVVMELDGLVLNDLTREPVRNPDVVVEPLSWENAADYAARCTDATAAGIHDYLLASAHRYLQAPSHAVHIFVARLDQEVAGYAVLRIEPHGVAYFAGGLTVKGFRRRGVYLSMVAHRLAVARATGCTAAIIGAQTATSAPILIKRGFKPVCRFVGLVPPRKTT